MKVFISTWQPWAWGNRNISLQDRVDMAKNARAELCMKGTHATGLYGPNTWNMFKLYLWARGKSNDDLELLAKQNNLPVQLWCFPFLQYPAGSARAINDAIARWNPTDVFLDVELRYAKDYYYNTGAFLRSLGPVNDIRFWLQSYRRPDYHPEIVWNKWLTYKDPNGKRIIHGVAPQAYPMGSQDFVSDFQRMVTKYAKILDIANRRDIPWFPTLPTFSERGWEPTLDAMIGGVDFLKQELGSRLTGLNFWQQDWLLKTENTRMRTYIGTLASDVQPPSPPTKVPQRIYIHDHLHPWAKTEGYDGPNPDIS